MKPKLYRYQYFCMVVLYCLSGIFLPGILERSRGTASYPAFLAAPIGLLPILLLTAALKGEGGISAIAKRRLGKLAGGAVSLVYIAYFLLCAGELLCFYGLYLSAGEAPLFYLVPITLTVTLAAACGTTALGRTAVIFAPLMLIFALGLGASGVIRGDFRNFLPFAVLSWEELGRIALMLGILSIGQVAAVIAIAPADCRTAGLTTAAALIPNLAVTGIAAAAVLLDGQTPLLNDVLYFSQTASGDFTELKVIAAFVLFFCAAFRMSVCLRAAAAATAELANAGSARRFVFAYAPGILAIALILPQNLGSFAEYLLRYAPVSAALPLVILPLVLLAFRRRENPAK